MIMSSSPVGGEPQRPLWGGDDSVGEQKHYSPQRLRRPPAGAVGCAPPNTAGRLGRTTAFFFIGVLLLSPTACRKSPPAQSLEPSQILEGLTLSQSADGALGWTLQARQAVLHDTDQTADLVEPRMEFFRAGKLVSRLSAATGAARTDTHDVRLSTAVVVESLADRTVLRTSTLDYSSKKGLFETRADVLVTRPGGVLRGKGLEAKPDLSEIRIFDQRTLVEKRSP